MLLNSLKLLDIVIKDENDNVVFQGMTENMPDELKKKDWVKANITGSKFIFHI